MGIQEIKIGDYIEGYEHWGNGVEPHKMRLIVARISENNGIKIYYGQADDAWHGARGGCISDKFGEVRLITDEKPFTVEWWKDNYKKKCDLAVWSRDWTPGDVVKKHTGEFFRIIKIGVNTENNESVVIYKHVVDSKEMFVTPKRLFDSAVDKEKYPDSEQEWQFEIFILSKESDR